jgi:ABC-2 type transport system permease protein
MTAILKKEFSEIFKTKKFIILVVLFLFIAVASPALAKITPELLKNIPSGSGISINLPAPSFNDSIDQFIKNVSQFALLVLVFLFAGTIAEEKNKKTLEIVLTKPVSRVSLVLSKFIAAFVSMTAVYLVSCLIFYAYTYLLFGTFSFANFSLLALLLLVYMLFITATTILCSTFTSSQIVSAFIAFGVEIVIVSILGLVQSIKKFLPGHVLSFYKDIFTGIKTGEYLPSLLVSIGLIILWMILSIVVFRKQEIER